MKIFLSAQLLGSYYRAELLSNKIKMHIFPISFFLFSLSENYNP